MNRLVAVVCLTGVLAVGSLAYAQQYVVQTPVVRVVQYQADVTPAFVQAVPAPSCACAGNVASVSVPAVQTVASPVYYSRFVPGQPIRNFFRAL